MSRHLTTHERYTRVYAHQEPDRIPVIDSPWAATIERWHREGMPEDVGYVDFFGLDKIAHIDVDNSPRYPVKVIEETDEYIVNTTSWGATLKNWKHIASTPEFIDFRIADPDAWQAAKARMTPSRDRIPWERLARDYGRWRREGYWIEARLWFGFDVTHSWTVGTERLLMALLTDPEWCVDMFNTFLDIDIALLDQVWDAGYTFDEVNWPDDMGYKQNQFFSVRTYRKLLKPVHHNPRRTRDRYLCTTGLGFLPERFTRSTATWMVNVPLEETYAAAFTAVAARWQRVLEESQPS